MTQESLRSHSFLRGALFSLIILDMHKQKTKRCNHVQNNERENKETVPPFFCPSFVSPTTMKE